MGRLNLRRRLSDESGSATIEAVLWMPVFVFILTLIFDTSLTFLGKAQVMRLMQDANRAYSTGQIRSLQEAEEFVRSGIEAMGANAEVTTWQIGNIVRTDVTLRAGDLSGVGVFQRIANTNIRLSSQHLVEG